MNDELKRLSDHLVLLQYAVSEVTKRLNQLEDRIVELETRLDSQNE